MSQVKLDLVEELSKSEVSETETNVRIYISYVLCILRRSMPYVYVQFVVKTLVSLNLLV
jgi:hypothetical protein